MSDHRTAKDFEQIEWDAALADACRTLVRLAAEEDLAGQEDVTTASLVPIGLRGAAKVVARQQGVIAGLPIVPLVLERLGPGVTWTSSTADGQTVEQGAVLGQIEGPAGELLVAERTLLNFLGRLSGIATLTAKYVSATTGTQASIYDTRKTTPGWRRLEKYAVRQGGGRNHRLDLSSAVLIKDNHLAFGASAGGQAFSPAAAVRKAREYLTERGRAETMIEIEVDTLDQLQIVLPARPDIVLLDNMSVEQLRQAVAMRDAAAPATQLEASGGVRLDTVTGIARLGVDRISVGGLTHGAIWLDIALDWE